ncbi:MAG: glycosyltransferase family 4 protein [Nitrospira sp.]|nr:glycosyltransferase family 4 protein [Nitrospira sp.]
MRRAQRFCMVTTFYPPYNFGGDGIFIYRLANELARRGNTVDIIHCRDAFEFLSDGGKKGDYPNHPNVRVYGLKSWAGFLSPLMTHQTGVPFYKRKTIKELFEKNGYDVIHFHNMSLIGITALQYGSAVKLYTMHEYWLLCPMHFLWKFNREVCRTRNCVICTVKGKRLPQFWRYTGLLGKMLRHVDGFISPSRFSQDKHHELGLDIPIRHIPYFFAGNGDQDEIVSGRESASDTVPYFLFVGRLENIKGLQNLISVFKKQSQYNLLIAGEGEYGDVLKELAEDVYNIKFLGRLDHQKLKELYRDAVALIVPSIWYEVFGIIIIESFAMGTPVIVNNMGGMPELIKNSGGGFIYNNNDELVSIMGKLANNIELRRELGDRAYQAYQKYYSEDTHIENYLNYIQELQEKRTAKNRVP